MSIIPQLIVNSIIVASIYTLVALGFNLAYSTTKFFNLAHGVLAAVGAYIVFYIATHLGWNIYVAVIAGVLGAGLTGYLADRIVYLPLRRRKASGLVLLVASLGVFTMLQALLAILFTSQFQTLSNFSPVQRVFEIGGAYMTGMQMVILAAALAMTLALALVLKFTMFGKAVKAVADDAEVAQIVGINTDRVIGIVFFISGALAGLAGIFVGFDTGIEPTMGLLLLLSGIIASIVGGIGNVYAGIVGALALGLVDNFGIWKISGEWRVAMAYGLLILFLIFRPQGIFKR
jgi:branched-chain amino acid transport system permease protein